MYMCICIYVCVMYVRVYVYVCMYIYICICLYGYIYIYIMYIYSVYIYMQRILQWCYCSPLYPVSMNFCILVCLFIEIVCSILCDSPTIHSS